MTIRKFLTRSILSAACVALLAASAPAEEAVANPFSFATPERTWATYKFAIDTADKALFQACLDPQSKDYKYVERDFEKLLRKKGPVVSASRAVSSQIEGEKATLQVDFYGKEADGKVFHDADPVQLVLRDGKWLLTGF